MSRFHYNHTVLLLCVFLLYGSMREESQKKVLLRVNLEKGTSYTINMITDQDILQSPMGQNSDMHQKMGYTYRMTVKDIENGIYYIETIYDRIIYSQQSAFASVEYDSADPPEEIPPSAAGYAAMVGLGFHMKMDNMGKIHSLEGIDEFYEQTIQNTLRIIGDTSIETENQMRSALYGIINVDGLKSSLQNLALIYPEEAVKKGFKWKQDSEFNTGLKLLMKTTYEVVEIQQDKVIIMLNRTIQSDKDFEMKANGFRMKYDLTGEQSGKMVVDIKTGMTDHTDQTQNLKGKIIMNGTGIPDDTSWPVEFDTKVTLKGIF